MKQLRCFFKWEGKSQVCALEECEALKCLSCFCYILHEKVWEIYGIPACYQVLSLNGRLLQATGCTCDKEADAGCGFVEAPFYDISVSSRLLGGKGGFGSLLRGQRGARKKVKNFDACRDLSGQRLRNAKAVDRLAVWLERRRRDNELTQALGGETFEANQKKQSTAKAKTPREPCGISLSPVPLHVVGEHYFETIEKTRRTTTKAMKKMPTGAMLGTTPVWEKMCSSNSNRGASPTEASGREEPCGIASSKTPDKARSSSSTVQTADDTACAFDSASLPVEGVAFLCLKDDLSLEAQRRRVLLQRYAQIGVGENLDDDHSDSAENGESESTSSEENDDDDKEELSPIERASLSLGGGATFKNFMQKVSLKHRLLSEKVPAVKPIGYVKRSQREKLPQTRKKNLDGPQSFEKEKKEEFSILSHGSSLTEPRKAPIVREVDHCNKIVTLAPGGTNDEELNIEFD